MSSLDDGLRDVDGGQRQERLHGPRFTPLDVAAFLLVVLMIWGPLAAGALRQ